MALDDILKEGERARKVDEVEKEFQEHPYLPLAQTLDEALGTKMYEDARNRGVNLVDVHPARNYEFLNAAKASVQENLSQKVRENYNEVVSALVEHEKGLGALVSLIAQIEPGKIEADKEMLDAHKEAHEALKADPQKCAEKYLAKQKTTYEREVASFIVRTAKPERLVHVYMSETQKELYKKLGSADKAKKYLDSLYNHPEADDKIKNDIAYRMGRILTELKEKDEE